MGNPAKTIDPTGKRIGSRLISRWAVNAVNNSSD